jgi:hypothetical protein
MQGCTQLLTDLARRPGVPMAGLSGRLAAASLLVGLSSTRHSSRGDMCGGTSTD